MGVVVDVFVPNKVKDHMDISWTGIIRKFGSLLTFSPCWCLGGW